MDSARLQELRAALTECEEGGYCTVCAEAWPCEDSQILDLALESFELRGLAKAAQLNYINESLEAERLRADIDEWKQLRELEEWEKNRAIDLLGLATAETERLRARIEKLLSYADYQTDRGIKLYELTGNLQRRVADLERERDALRLEVERQQQLNADWLVMHVECCQINDCSCAGCGTKTEGQG